MNPGDTALRIQFEKQVEYDITFRSLLAPLRPKGGRSMRGRFKPLAGGFKLWSVDLDGIDLKNYAYNDRGNKYGGNQRVNIQHQTFEPTQNKAVSLEIDHMQGMLSTESAFKRGRMLGYFMKKKFRTYWIKYVLNTIHATANADAYSSINADFTLAANNSVKEQLVADKWAIYANSDGNTDDGRLVCFMRSTIAAQLENEAEFVLPSSAAWNSVVRRGEISPISRVRIMPVPPTLMPDGVNYLMLDDMAIDMPIYARRARIIDDPEGVDGRLEQFHGIMDAWATANWRRYLLTCKTA